MTLSAQHAEYQSASTHPQQEMNQVELLRRSIFQAVPSDDLHDDLLPKEQDCCDLATD